MSEAASSDEQEQVVTVRAADLQDTLDLLMDLRFQRPVKWSNVEGYKRLSAALSASCQRDGEADS